MWKWAGEWLRGRAIELGRKIQRTQIPKTRNIHKITASPAYLKLPSVGIQSFPITATLWTRVRCCYIVGVSIPTTIDTQQYDMHTDTHTHALKDTLYVIQSFISRVIPPPDTRHLSPFATTSAITLVPLGPLCGALTVALRSAVIFVVEIHVHKVRCKI